MKFLLILVMIAGLSLPALARQRIQLGCIMEAPRNWTDGAGFVQSSQTECARGVPGVRWSDFPYKIPEGKTLCVTDLILSNKFPYDPPEYGTRMRTMYGEIYGFSVSAHAPYLHLRTPMAYDSSWPTIFRAWIWNGMSEAQNVYLNALGYLADSRDCE